MNPSVCDRQVRSESVGSLLEYRTKERSRSPEPGMTVLDELSMVELARLSGAPTRRPSAISRTRPSWPTGGNPGLPAGN
jgi:hypothetical protein